MIGLKKKPARKAIKYLLVLFSLIIVACSKNSKLQERAGVAQKDSVQREPDLIRNTLDPDTCL